MCSFRGSFHFGANITSAYEGEDPPDIYLNIKGEKIAVEITRLSPVSFEQNGTVQNRNTQDYFGLNLCNEIDSKLKTKVPPKVDIILTLYVPVENVRKYKKELYKYLENIIDSGINVGDKEKIDLSGSKVNISVVPNRDHSQKKVVGFVVNNDSSPHILSNAEVILEGRILDKVEKCKKIQHDGSIWLALFNDYWLANHETYLQALNNISVKHDFGMILIVSDTRKVSQIY